MALLFTAQSLWDTSNGRVIFFLPWQMLCWLELPTLPVILCSSQLRWKKEIQFILNKVGWIV